MPGKPSAAPAVAPRITPPPMLATTGAAWVTNLPTSLKKPSKYSSYCSAAPGPYWLSIKVASCSAGNAAYCGASTLRRYGYVTAAGSAAGGPTSSAMRRGGERYERGAVWTTMHLLLLRLGLCLLVRDP